MQMWISDLSQHSLAQGARDYTTTAHRFSYSLLLCALLLCSSGTGHCHHQTLPVLSPAAGAFPSSVCRIADTPSSQRTGDSVLSVVSPLAGAAGRVAPCAWALLLQPSARWRCWGDIQGAHGLFRNLSTMCFLLELCAQRKAKKKELYEKANFGAKN